MEDKLPRRIAWFAPWTWRRRWLVTAALVLLFVVYPLSAGPAFGLAISGWLPMLPVMLLYRPIVLIASSNPEATEWVEWYISLFVVE